MSTTLLAPSTRRRLATISCLAIATLATSAPTTTVQSGAAPLGACTVRPTADSMPFADALLDTWRIRDGVSEILHDVRCTDGRAGSVWIAADVI